MTDVRVVEVGPRDGLQNEKQVVPTATKLEFDPAPDRYGLRDIEATSFVSPKWVPRMADHAKIMKCLQGIPACGKLQEISQVQLVWRKCGNAPLTVRPVCVNYSCLSGT